MSGGVRGGNREEPAYSILNPIAVLLETTHALLQGFAEGSKY
jgi:hypothetical protein